MSSSVDHKAICANQVKLVAGKLRPFVTVDVDQGTVGFADGFLDASLQEIDPALSVAELRKYQDAEQLIAASAKLAIGQAAHELRDQHAGMSHLSGRFDLGNTEVRATWDREVSGRMPGRNGEPGAEYTRQGVVETRYTPRGNASAYFNAAKDALNALNVMAGDAE